MTMKATACGISLPKGLTCHKGVLTANLISKVDGRHVTVNSSVTIGGLSQSETKKHVDRLKAERGKWVSDKNRKKFSVDTAKALSKKTLQAFPSGAHFDDDAKAILNASCSGHNKPKTGIG